MPGDHFSQTATGYAAYRPRYPRELFDFIVSLAPARRVAWDVGAGNGQATTVLAEYFDHVIGTDISAAQLAEAPANDRIEWLVAPAEHVPIESGTVDLITVAQALHWFDHDRFYAEVHRVASPGAAIAAWTYLSAQAEGQVGDIVRRYMTVDVGPYWPPERKFVDDAYRSIPFPFERVETPPFVLTYEWTLDQLAGYLRTISATSQYVKAHGVDPVVSVERELAGVWGPASATHIVWPIVLLAGRCGSLRSGGAAAALA